jgi:hypothetical protein
MKRRYVFVPLGVVAMLSYGLFTGGPDVPMDDYAETGAGLIDEDKLDTLASTFGGKAIEVGKGISVAATELAVFEPTDPSVLDAGARPQRFEITVTNNSAKDIDLFSLAIVESDIAGSKEAVCLDLFDEAQGIMGVPFEPVKPGASVTFPWAMGCPGAEGADLTLTIAITDKTQVDFSGKLA